MFLLNFAVNSEMAPYQTAHGALARRMSEAHGNIASVNEALARGTMNEAEAQTWLTFYTRIARYTQEARATLIEAEVAILTLAKEARRLITAGI